VLALASDLMRPSQQKLLLLSRHGGLVSETALFLMRSTQNSGWLNAPGRRACGGGQRRCRPAIRGPCCSSCKASPYTRRIDGRDRKQGARRARNSYIAAEEAHVPCVGVRSPVICAHRTFGIRTSCIAYPGASWHPGS
jgi:hypothetical protein